MPPLWPGPDASSDPDSNDPKPNFRPVKRRGKEPILESDRQPCWAGIVSAERRYHGNRLGRLKGERS